MTTIAFILAFVLLALGTFFVAFQGGPRSAGSGAAVRQQSRAGRRAGFVFFVLALLALVFAVPGAVIAAMHNRDNIPSANVTNLTAQEKHGRELFGYRCAACHTLKASNAVAFVGPNLDQLRPPAALVQATIKSGASGAGEMPAGLYQGQDAKDIAAYVAKATGAAGS